MRKGDFFGSLSELHRLIADALDELPSPEKKLHTRRIGKQLVIVRRDFALYTKKIQENARK
jgi:hypothetical protein